MKPHRVLYMTEADVFGGAERYMLLLLERLNREHFSPAVARHPNAPSELTDALKSLEVPTYPLTPIKGKSDIKGLRNQRTFLKEQKPDIVHLNLANPLHGQFSMLAARWAKIPIKIATMHLPPRTTTPTSRGRFLERQTLGALDRLIAVCRSSKNLMMNHFSLPDQQVEVVYNGLDPTIFEDQKVTRESLGLPWPDGPLVGTVGRMTEQKGQDIFLEAIPAILEAIPNARFAIIGDGPLRQRLEDQVQALNISHCVHFTGQRLDIPQLLNALDLFVLPSRYESFPFSILEAMAAGKPVVVTDVDGVSESVSHNENGLVVPREDAPALAEAIVALLRDHLKADEMGNRNRTRIHEQFTLAHMTKNTEAIYQQCLSTRNIT